MSRVSPRAPAGAVGRAAAVRRRPGPAVGARGAARGAAGVSGHLVGLCHRAGDFADVTARITSALARWCTTAERAVGPVALASVPAAMRWRRGWMTAEASAPPRHPAADPPRSGRGRSGHALAHRRAIAWCAGQGFRSLHCGRPSRHRRSPEIVVERLDHPKQLGCGRAPPAGTRRPCRGWTSEALRAPADAASSTGSCGGSPVVGRSASARAGRRHPPGTGRLEGRIGGLRQHGASGEDGKQRFTRQLIISS